MFFIYLSNNCEYFSKKFFNRYLNLYPYYLLILLCMQQLNLLLCRYIFFLTSFLLYTYLTRLQTQYPNFHANSVTLNNLLGTMNYISFLCLTIKVINKIDLCNNIILYSLHNIILYSFYFFSL